MRTLKKLLHLPQRLMLHLKFNSGDYWKVRYRASGDSGLGSYGTYCQNKANVLNQILERFQIEDVIEFGCGDGNQLKYYQVKKYLGLDISDDAILRCREIFKADRSKSFMQYNPRAFFNSGDIFAATAAISIDVIFHLVEDQVFAKYMEDLFSCAERYVIISSSNHSNNHGGKPHVKHHMFTDYIDHKWKEWKLVWKDEGQGEFDKPFYVFEKNG